MAARYKIGQKVVIKPAQDQRLSPRDSDLAPYAGQSGQITDYYWITLDRGITVVYIYTVRMETGDKEVVLHEDELEADTA